MMNPISKLFYISLLLHKISCVNSAIYTVIAGDASDFVSVLSNVHSYDTVVVPPGSYTINDNLDSLVPSGVTNLYIRGNGATPSKTMLLGLTVEYYSGYLVMDNLAIYGKNDTDSYSATIEQDNDDGMIFRNSLIYTNNNGNHGIDIMSDRIGFINTVITNQVSYPISTSHAYTDEGNGLVMLNSKIVGYDYALDLGHYYWSDNLSRDYKVYNTNLASNHAACHVCTDYDTCTDSVTTCPTLALTPNTPVGQKYTVNNFIDILRYVAYHDAPYVPVSVYFLKVKTAGETTVYRLPSAYPAPPIGWNSATGDVQYYQFDSTAVLNNASPTVYFTKSAIVSQFPVGATIQCFTYVNLGWVNVPITVVNSGASYALTFPSKTSLTGLLAFLYQ